MTDEHDDIELEHDELNWHVMPEFDGAQVQQVYGFTRDADQEDFSGLIVGFKDGRAMRVMPQGEEMVRIDIQEVESIEVGDE